ISLAVDQQHGIKRWIQIFRAIQVAKGTSHFERSHAKAPVEAKFLSIFLKRGLIFMYVNIQANQDQSFWIIKLLAHFSGLTLLEKTVGAPLRHAFDQHNFTSE